ncbi:MAG: HAD family phosphatase [Candidatus Aenigmarchaeota archaeon]|nr:HAD family phosphatase [Candidatus Aenigmarchaeota archaeon]
MIKAIAFDLGGVYYTWNFPQHVRKLSKFTGASENAVKKAYLKNLKDFHVSRISEKEFWKRFCKSIKKDFDYRKLSQVDMGTSKPVKPVVNIVRKLRKNYKVLMLTNNTTRFDYIDKKYGISHDFDVVISSHKVKMQKPYKNMYRLLIKKANCKPGEILFIDDLERNLKPARKMGINTVLFKNVKQLKKDLHKYEIR